MKGKGKGREGHGAVGFAINEEGKSACFKSKAGLKRKSWVLSNVSPPKNKEHKKEGNEQDKKDNQSEDRFEKKKSKGRNGEWRKFKKREEGFQENEPPFWSFFLASFLPFESAVVNSLG